MSSRLIADLEAFGLSEMPPAPIFFKPTAQFFEQMQSVRGLDIIDVGGGQGHVAHRLREHGHTAHAIDLRGIGETEYPVRWGNGRTHNYPAGSVVLICRPCHGDFIEDTIARAIERDVAWILYIGKEEHAADDLGRFAQQFRFWPMTVGEEGEKIWILHRSQRG